MTLRKRDFLLSLLAAGGLGAARAQRIALPVWGVAVVKAYPHDPGAFTQGLEWHDGHLYESTGLEGQSSVRKVSLADGRVLQKAEVPAEHFGEGMTIVGDEIYSLTWKSQLGFVWDLKTLRKKREFRYAGEGWGLTHNGEHLIMSDGTAQLRFLEPATMKEVRRVPVSALGRPLENLNELEWVDGQVWANVWQQDVIARIDPASGQVRGWIDLRGLLPQSQARQADVLNGIAWDAAAKRLFVTGKLWPQLFEIRLVPRA